MLQIWDPSEQFEKSLFGAGTPSRGKGSRRIAGGGAVGGSGAQANHGGDFNNSGRRRQRKQRQLEASKLAL